MFKEFFYLDSWSVDRRRLSNFSDSFLVPDFIFLCIRLYISAKIKHPETQNKLLVHDITLKMKAADSCLLT